jgi:NADH dehydrogenase (ubiquinone) 1 beta subcomplex subunit 9
MTASFAAVQASYRAGEALSHRQTVTRLYRRSLRLLESWTPHRGSFNEQASVLRARFDANKRLDAEGAGAGAVARLVREAQEEAARWTHPDMYTVPYMPGGTKFMRNPPLPLSVCYPDGLPHGVEEIASKDVNGIQLPMSAAGAQGMRTVLIDAMKRTAE